VAFLARVAAAKMLPKEAEDSFFVLALLEFVQVLMTRAIYNPEFLWFGSGCK
jgi:hypothetical protein